MSMRNLAVGLLCVVFAAVVASPVRAADEVSGTVAEKGFGSFKLSDKSGTARLFNESQRSTKYSPDTWRPANGDTVKVSYTEVQKKSGIVHAVDTVTLVTRGPESVEIKSPVTVQILEKGRGAVKVKLGDSDKVVRFLTGKATTWQPSGWAPSAGEKAKISFHAQAAPIGFTVSYVADSIEQVK